MGSDWGDVPRVRDHYVKEGRMLLAEAREADFDDHCRFAGLRLGMRTLELMEEFCQGRVCGAERTTERSEHVRNTSMTTIEN